MDHLTDETLNELLDRALPEAAWQAAEGHLASCPTCRQRLERLERLFASLAALPEVSLARDLARPVVARLQEDQVTSAARRLPVWARLALAGQLLSAAVLAAALWPLVWPWLSAARQALNATWRLALPAIDPALLLERLLGQSADAAGWLQSWPPAPAMAAGSWLLVAGLVLSAWLLGNGLLLKRPR